MLKWPTELLAHQDISPSAPNGKSIHVGVYASLDRSTFGVSL